MNRKVRKKEAIQDAVDCFFVLLGLGLILSFFELKLMRIVDKTLGFWARKVLHLLLNGSIAIAALLISPDWIKPLTVVGFIAVLVFESARLKTKARRFVHEAVGPLFKREESSSILACFDCCRALIVALFAEPLAYSYGFAVLAIADFAAAAVGRS